MTHVPNPTPLSHFSLLSFDIYGTLIDWETGIGDALLASPHLVRLPASHPLRHRPTLLVAIEAHERALQAARPRLPYSQVLAGAYAALVEAHGLRAAPAAGAQQEAEEDKEEEEAQQLAAAAAAFGASVGRWPAFPDTVAAMQALGRRYKLAVLSNVDGESLARSRAGPLAGVRFDAVVTAQDVGSYKPDRRNFAALLARVGAELGVARGAVLHVAQSLFHDHVPAAEVGLPTVWVDRGGAMGEVGAEVRERARYGWRVESLGELAEMVDREGMAER